MIKYITYTLIFISLLSCGGKHTDTKSPIKSTKPVIKENGKFISFPADTITTNFFKTQIISSQNIEAEITAPARVVASVVSSSENSKQHLILFDNPDLASNYTQLVQHLINISNISNVVIPRKKEIVERTEDLQKNGAETEEKLNNVKTELKIEEANLANEQAAIIEHESKLKLAGLNSEALRNAKANSVWVICDIPENQLEKIKIGSNCKVMFTSYPDKIFTGVIEDLGDVVDNVTRMVKLRLSIFNPDGKLKAGMYATANFGVSEGNFISIPKSALVTVQSKNFVFVKKSENEFERKEISIGQQINDRIIVFSGLSPNDVIVVDGVIQLKGISFGY